MICTRKDLVSASYWLLATVFGVVATPAVAANRPDVLFIAVDDLNDWVGALRGHPQATTPNIDRLAARGVLFTNAHCAAPACNPSRVALMTGRAPTTTGIYHNNQPWRPVLSEVATLPQHFRTAGYRVIGGGKIYHGRFPDSASWDEYFPSQEKNKPDDPMPAGRPLSGIPGVAHFDWGPVEATDVQMGDARVVDWACGQLAASRDRPLFLAVGVYRPHLPWYVPSEYFAAAPSLEEIVLPDSPEDDLDDLPPAGVRMARPGGDHRKVVAHGQWRAAVQAYLASIAFADRQVGRLLDALDASGRADRTIVVLWSDHGWHLGEKQHWRKFALWEEATRVPLAFIAPGVTSPGGRCAAPASLLDVYPTLVELCALPENPTLEGESLVPQLRKPGAPSRRAVLTTHGRGNHAIRDSRYRLIRYADGGEELYDLSEDPGQWRNLAEEPALARLKRSLAARSPRREADAAPAADGRESK